MTVKLALKRARRVRRAVTLVPLFCLTTVPLWAQDTADVLGQALQAYGGEETKDGKLFAGLSAWGLMGGLIFGSVGFVAFVYGKKNAEFRPMLLGVALMVYPYIVQGTLWVYLVGAGLTAALFLWRE